MRNDAVHNQELFEHIHHVCYRKCVMHPSQQ